ncbi:DegT/DnrJ/EryC1/StrS family aminotransferase [Sphingomonas sp. MMS24-J13]|uniref:DegT/DnrJ/EryC1/StrS family aminotransferase n=1 Tax=Sphingomonas sp. MMS24-J13 TaxID=3238686 RepID=UPI00384EE891
MTGRERVTPLYVTKPIPPDRAVFDDLVQRMVEQGIYTNFGPLERDLTERLSHRFGVRRMMLTNNGTSALLAALLALGKIGGTVITTPFTFAATVHSITLAGFRVKFADVDRDTLNLSPESVRSVMTDDVVAILPVHVYGNPCDVPAFDAIGREFGVTLIYDAAHCFDVYENGRSIYLEGDLSVGSLHATKLMHTGEGGLLCASNGVYLDRVRQAINFGIEGEEIVSGVGFNGKMSEVNAAMGLSVLPMVGTEIARRKIVHDLYVAMLARLPGVIRPTFRASVTRNYMYFPVLVTEQAGFSRDAWWTALRQKGIFARKYFYPLISNCSPYDQIGSIDLPAAAWGAERALCLPIHRDVTEDDVKEIVQTAAALV